MPLSHALIVVATMLCGLSTAVWSQVRVGPTGGVHIGGGYRPAYPYGALGGWWGGFNYSGDIGVTPAESQARGYAEAIRAQGQAYENISRGMVDYEKARSAYIENQKQWHETAMERQQMGMAQREKYYANERAKRDRRESMHPTTPTPKLSESQYDRASGSIEWPELLQSATYAEDRKAIEDLAAVRAQTGGTSAVSENLYTAARALQNKLKLQIRDVSPQVYLESRKFLDLLATDARQG